jgi:hypothetical protein
MEIDLLTVIILLLIGIASATFGSIVGLGGGIITVPALIYLGPALLMRDIPSTVAVGTSTAVLVVTALSSSISYKKQNKIDFRSGWLFFIVSGPAAMAGAMMTQRIEQGLFFIIFGFFMLLISILMILRNRLKPVRAKWPIQRQYTDDNGEEQSYGYSIPMVLLVGAAVGCISGLFGIGGGSLLVPAMVLLFRFPPHVATATSMFVIFLSAILGSTVHAAYGKIDLLLAAALIPGAWLGGKLGVKIASRMSGSGLLWLLRITLLVLAAYMIISGFTS